MKILISNESQSAHYFIRLGLARAFNYCGHEVDIWDMNSKSLFDAIDEKQPDILFYPLHLVTDSLIRLCKERPDMKLVCKMPDWGNISDEIDRDKFPVLIASDKDVENCKRLLELDKPDVGYVHYLQNRIDEETHNHWVDLGVNMMSLLNAADVFSFTNGEYREEYASDICFIGGRWGYKGQVLDKWFIPLLDPKHDHNIKIFGNSDWGVPQYCGFAPESEMKHIMKSAKICINLHEPHSQEYGYDVIERPFKIASNKCFCISDWIDDLEEILPSTYLCDTPEGFHSAINEVINNREEFDNDVENNYEIVIADHTYFDRIHSVFSRLGFDSESAQVLAKFPQVKEELKL